MSSFCEVREGREGGERGGEGRGEGEGREEKREGEGREKGENERGEGEGEGRLNERGWAECEGVNDIIKFIVQIMLLSLYICLRLIG